MTAIDLQRIILYSLRSIEAQKIIENRHPHHVMLIRDNPFKSVETLCTRDEFNGFLKELEECEMIKIGHTINDTYLSVLGNTNTINQ